MQEVIPRIYGLAASFTAPYIATLTGTLTADRIYTFPDAAITIAGTDYDNNWTVTQDFAAITASGQITSTVATGTAPLVVASTTLVSNLHAANSDALGGATFAAPGAIGSGTPGSGAFTTLSASGVITSTLATGTAPLVIASTTVVANLNASLLLGQTWANPGAIGGTTPAAGAFTTVTASGNVQSTGGSVLAGSGSAFTQVAANGSNSGSGGGSMLNVYNGGTLLLALGNKSAIVGGAYDASRYLYTAGAGITCDAGISCTTLTASGAISGSILTSGASVYVSNTNGISLSDNAVGGSIGYGYNSGRTNPASHIWYNGISTQIMSLSEAGALTTIAGISCTTVTATAGKVAVTSTATECDFFTGNNANGRQFEMGANVAGIGFLTVRNNTGTIGVNLNGEGSVAFGATGMSASERVRIVGGSTPGAAAAGEVLIGNGEIKAGAGISCTTLTVASADYVYLRGDASTDGSVRFSSQSAGTMLIEKRASGSWVSIGSFA